VRGGRDAIDAGTPQAVRGELGTAGGDQAPPGGFGVTLCGA
jgi:hypothetical protein